MNLEERFWSKVDRKGKKDCWIWTRAIRGEGYGVFRYKGKTIDSHRFAWFLVYGELPENQVLHKCDNKICCNPDHLFIGTQQDNIKDMVDKGRRPYRFNSRKLKKSDSVEIRKLYNDCGYTEVEIAEKYNISSTHVSNILSNRTWKD